MDSLTITHTYIIGHYNRSVRIIDLVSHTFTKRTKMIKISYKNGDSVTVTYRALRGDYGSQLSKL